MITRSQVKYIQSLSEKKFRKESGCFVAEGPKIINEFLADGYPELVALYATAPWVETSHAAGIKYDESKFLQVGDSELKSMSFLSTPNQVLALFKIPDEPAGPDFHSQISLILDGIQDPGNLGTIIRIADWYGIRYIIAGNNCADALSPKVVQSTMGSISRVKVLYTELDEFVSLHKDIPLYAAALDGVSVFDIGRVEEGFLMIGNESKGIGAALMTAASHKITIPRIGRAESLNAAVATGILLSGMRK